jgi:hypothetical protein
VNVRLAASAIVGSIAARATPAVTVGSDAIVKAENSQPPWRGSHIVWDPIEPPALA